MSTVPANQHDHTAPARIELAPNGVATVTLTGVGPLNIISKSTEQGLGHQLRA